MFSNVRGSEFITRGKLRIFSPLLCRLNYPAVIDDISRRVVGFSLCSNVIVGQPRTLSELPNKLAELPSLCLLEFKLQSAT